MSARVKLDAGCLTRTQGLRPQVQSMTSLGQNTSESPLWLRRPPYFCHGIFTRVLMVSGGVPLCVHTGF